MAARKKRSTNKRRLQFFCGVLVGAALTHLLVSMFSTKGATGLRTQSSCSSSYSLSQDVAVIGGKFDAYSAVDYTINDCCERCKGRSECVSFSFVEATQSCILSRSTKIVVSAGVSSGVAKRVLPNAAMLTTKNVVPPPLPPPTPPLPVEEEKAAAAAAVEKEEEEEKEAEVEENSKNATTCAGQFDKETDIDYLGGDLPSSYLSAGSWDTCCEMCRQRDGCTAFSFVTASGSCWLKGGAGKPTPKKGVTSGRRAMGRVVALRRRPPLRLPGCDNFHAAKNTAHLHGIVQAHVTVPTTTAADCCAHCQKSQACHGFEFHAGNCHIHHKVTSAHVVKKGWVSGVRALPAAGGKPSSASLLSWVLPGTGSDSQAAKALLAYIGRDTVRCGDQRHMGGVMVRGGVEDGAWEVCFDHIRPPCVAYSFGVADDTSFDVAMGAYGCEVHAFDPSIGRASGKIAPNVWFHDIGLGAVDTDSFDGVQMVTKQRQRWKVRRLDSLMAMLSHSSVDLLKIDVEGNEWAVLEALTAGTGAAAPLRRVQQLVFEVHFWGASWPLERTATIQRWHSLLLAVESHGFKLFSHRENPQSTRENLGLDRPTPCCFELSYMRMTQTQAAGSK